MVFSSPTFLFIFLPVVFLCNLALKRSIRASNVLLLVASLVFYAWGEPVYVLLMVVTTFANYLAARQMGGGPGRRKAAAALACVWNIGSLVLFKYTDFLLSTLNQAFGLALPLPQIALPIGISFFTFQAMSYVLDVYRGDARINRNYFDILLYISLFPQLIAGPIVKYHDIDTQIQQRSITLEQTAAGFRRFCFGLAKKVLIANTLAVTVDRVFALDAGAVNAPIAWLGAVCYLMQIYFDFSGYSDMAIGLGHAFGFDFKENFNHPYTAQSMQDFWRRWHISLSTWFKLYVYIPLGGNRKGKLRTGINKMLVFLLTGLWHGANWTFALWGLYHGGFLMLESSGVLKPGKWPRALRHVYVVLAALVGFVLFRSETFAQAGHFISSMLVGWGGGNTLLASLCSPLTLLALACGACASTGVGRSIKARLERRRFGEAAIYVAAMLLLVVCMLSLSTAAYNPFIYFRF